MTRDEFKLIHSELIMQVQMIENDLRMIYAGIKPGDFVRVRLTHAEPYDLTGEML
jgi:hypothetical protein